MEEKPSGIENLFRVTRQHEPVNVTVTNDLTDDEERFIQQTIQELYEPLGRFCAHYEIRPLEISLKREIAFKTALLWQEISGATAKSMESYGSLDESLKQEFQQYTSRMTELVNTIYLACK